MFQNRHILADITRSYHWGDKAPKKIYYVICIMLFHIKYIYIVDIQATEII